MIHQLPPLLWRERSSPFSSPRGDCVVIPFLSLRATERSVPARRSAAFRHAGVAIRRSRCEGVVRGNLKSSLALLGTRLRSFHSLAMTLRHSLEGRGSHKGCLKFIKIASENPFLWMGMKDASAESRKMCYMKLHDYPQSCSRCL
jgi:hypothetical protein